ncbi:MAG: hypothetical protein WCH34_02040 [Bacteroidota bacterium]
MQQYLAINHHDNVTKDSLLLCHHLGNYHFNKILAKAGDPYFDDMIDFYTPYIEEWNAAYKIWKKSFNDEMQATAEMDDSLALLIEEKAPEWVYGVLSKYGEKTPRVRGLIPHKRKAFISGSTQDKITGIDTFIEGLGSDPLLAGVKASAVAFLPAFKAAYTKQDKAKEDLANFSNDQHELRITLCQALHADEGDLTKHFFKQTSKVDLFFDISSMRKTKKATEDDKGIPINLLPDEIKLLDLRFTGKEIWSVENKAAKDACIFFGDTSTIVEIPEVKYVIAAGATLQIDLNTLSNDMRFAYAGNLSAEDNGQLVVTEVE